jgi:hypothetical protein
MEGAVSKITGSGWFAIAVLTVVANTLITIYLYPSQKPDYWWLPGSWIWFKLREWFWPPPPSAEELRRRFRAPRIA